MYGGCPLNPTAARDAHDLGLRFLRTWLGRFGLASRRRWHGRCFVRRVIALVRRVRRQLWRLGDSAGPSMAGASPFMMFLMRA